MRIVAMLTVTFLTITVQRSAGMGDRNLIEPDKFVQLSRSQLLDAMQAETAYDITATSNVARFQANVILRIVHALTQDDSTRRLFVVRHYDWFDAYLERTKLAAEEAPPFAQVAFELKQDQWIEYHPRHVVREVRKGRQPTLALNVLVAWDAKKNPKTHYTFEDTLATPRLRIRNNRVLSYRLLDFGDMIVYDELTGFYGRPTSGLLGLLFRMLGDGRITQSRLVQTEDGFLVAKTSAVKGPFRANPLTTIAPGGKMEKGLGFELRKRDYLMHLIEEPIQINYGPQLSEAQHH